MSVQVPTGAGAVLVVDDEHGLAVALAVALMCHDLGVQVVGEGVETAAARATLLALGCDLLHGYYIERPGRPFPTLR